MKVSIVMATYKREQYLREAIVSALDSDFDDNEYELIIVSDGYPEAEKVIDEFEDSVVDIRYYCLPKHQSRAHAINAGLRMVRGEYFTILDDDDHMMPNKLRDLSKYLNEHEDIHAVCTNAVMMNAEGQTISGPTQHPNTDYFEEPILLKKLLQGNYLHGGTLMYRSSLIEAIGMFNARVKGCEEWDYNVKLLMNGYNMQYINILTTKYRMHMGGKHIQSENNVKNGLYRGMRDWDKILVKNYRGLF